MATNETKHTPGPNTDPALWTTRRAFGVAGGPDEVVLTEAGNARAFSVGAQIRRGGPAEALEALWTARGEGPLSERVAGSSRIRRTALGRFDQIAWGYLRARNLVVSYQTETGEDGVRLTDAGRVVAQAGIDERTALLARCRRAAAIAKAEGKEG